MQIDGQPDLPAFEKRVALFGAPPQPMPPDMAPRRPFVTNKEKPNFVQVICLCTNSIIGLNIS